MNLKEHKVDKKRGKKLRELDTKIAVVEAVRLNISIPQIADNLGISVGQVRTHVDAALAEMQERYMENAKKLQMINIARLEHLYGIAEVWATGKGTWMDENSEGDPVKMTQVTPDRMWMKTAIDLIKAEMDISTKAFNQEAAEDKPPTTNINTTVIQQTLIAGGELFETARQSMEDDWFLEEGNVQWADLEGEDLISITSGEHTALDPRIADLEKEMDGMLVIEESYDADVP